MLFILKQSHQINQSHKENDIYVYLSCNLKQFHVNIKVSLTNNTTCNSYHARKISNDQSIIKHKDVHKHIYL